MRKICRQGIYTFKKPKGRMNRNGGSGVPHRSFLHAKDKPAIKKFLFFKGKPTILYEEWWLNGQLHRVDGPATKQYHSNSWWHNGKLHRLGGPAVEYINGSKEWWLNGERHRVDGPAVYNKGLNFYRFYLNNFSYNEDEWFNALTEEQKLSYLFKKGET